MKNNFSFWCQTFAVDAILHVSAGVPSEKRRIMNYTKIMLGGIVALSSTAFAMPTSEQTKKVEPLVVDLMRDDQAALKSGKKTRVEVAESAMSLADQAESEAAKLLLMKGAFNLYVRAGEFDKAIETLQSLQAAIPDIPPSNMANIIETSLRSVPRKNGGQLYRLLDETKTRMRYTNEAASLEKSVKKTPADRTLRLKLAEHYAYLGKWDLALENFVAAEGKVGAIAKSERGGESATEKIADFWWDYPNGKADELVRGFRVHAAKLYEDAIAAGAIKGLNKVQAERRIEEAKGYGENIFDGSDAGLDELVYKIGDGEKLEFVKCPAGTFIMGYENLGDAPQEHAHDRFKRHKVTITKPFLCSKTLVTYGQLDALVKLTNGEAARGTILSQWRFGEQNVLPIGEREKIVDALGGKQMCVCQYDMKNLEIIAGALTKKFSSKIPRGYVFRLPTEAEWEYVAKAGKGDKGVFGRYLLGNNVEKYIVDESLAWNEVVKQYPIFQTKEGIRLRNNFGYKVATKSSNEWGVFDLYDKRLSEATLDMINRGGPKGWQWFWFNYEDAEVDPWRCEERSSEQEAFRANVVRGVADRRSNSGMISAGKWTAHKEGLVWRFRFVIAPDTTQLNKYPRTKN